MALISDGVQPPVVALDFLARNSAPTVINATNYRCSLGPRFANRVNRRQAVPIFFLEPGRCEVTAVNLCSISDILDKVLKLSKGSSRYPLLLVYECSRIRLNLKTSLMLAHGSEIDIPSTIPHDVFENDIHQCYAVWAIDLPYRTAGLMQFNLVIVKLLTGFPPP